MTHKSAPEWLTLLEVVSMKPMNNPNCTTIRRIANTIPVRVTAKRTLSCRRLRRARRAIARCIDPDSKSRLAARGRCAADKQFCQFAHGLHVPHVFLNQAHSKIVLQFDDHLDENERLDHEI